MRSFMQAVSPKQLIRGRNVVRMLHSFADEYGLVYFGNVSWQNDEHHIVRGLTLSTGHHDYHYCIGTYEGYDVTFAERRDQLKDPKTNKLHPHKWYIMEFDLHTTVELPHVFIGLHSHSDSFYRQLFTKYPNLRAIQLGILSRHEQSFLSERRVYGVAEDVIAIEKLFSHEITQQIHAHFGSLAVEIFDSSLYIYSEKVHLSAALLTAMIKNGVWLARHIDEVAKQL